MNRDSRYTSCCLKETGIMQVVAGQIQDALKLLEKKPGCKDVREKLKGTMDLVQKVQPYTVSRSTPLSEFVQKIMDQIREMNFEALHEKGKVRYNYAKDGEFLNMASFPGQVQFLQFLIRKTNARNILEIGSYMGFATFGMAEAMPPGGMVTGIDIEPMFCDFVNELANERGIGVVVIYGDALVVLRKMAEEGNRYDLIYMDCVKHEYHEYYKIIMKNNLLAPDGMIVCDNTLLSGTSLHRSTSSGRSLDDFCQLVQKDERVTSVMLPCFDGVMLIQNVVCGECPSPQTVESAIGNPKLVSIEEEPKESDNTVEDCTSL